MKENQLKELLKNAVLVEKNSDLELEAFELIFELCLDKGYKLENILGNIEECSICEQQKFMHLVALQDDEILELVFSFHKTFAPTEFCLEDFKSKFELQLLENTFEITI